MKYWTVMPTSFPSLTGRLNRRYLATAYSSFVGFSILSYNRKIYFANYVMILFLSNPSLWLVNWFVSTYLYWPLLTIILHGLKIVWYFSSSSVDFSHPKNRFSAKLPVHDGTFPRVERWMHIGARLVLPCSPQRWRKRVRSSESPRPGQGWERQTQQ